MTRPLLIDLYCGQGGASEGYHRAGFRIIGVDINPQARYPFEFVQGDVFEMWDNLPHEDAIAYAASPPCQIHSAMTKGRWQDRLDGHVNLIPSTRKILQSTGKPYIIENVPGAKNEMENYIMLCGTMFKLQTTAGNQLRRHRLFETNFILWNPPDCNHNNYSVIGVYGGGQNPARKRTIGVYGSTGGTSKRDGDIGFGIKARKQAMGIDWMTNKGLNQAIPPAYTEWIGAQLIKIAHSP